MNNQKEGYRLLASLNACAKNKDLSRGSRLHITIIKLGFLRSNSAIARALIGMYAQGGALKKAHQVLEELPFRDVICWNALIVGYVHADQHHEALTCFDWMQCEGLSPDMVTFTSVLKACGRTQALEKGKQIHEKITNNGFLEKDVMLGTALVDMYAKCGVVTKAAEVLENLPVQDVVTWNALIGGYTLQGQCDEALNCYNRMLKKGITADIVTFLSILKVCGNANALEQGKLVHDEIVGKGLIKKYIVLGNALVDMYAKCGTYQKAKEVLSELPVRNVVSWNSLISGYSQQGQGHEALDSFEQMRNEGYVPHLVTYACVLNACGKVRAIKKAQNIHVEIVCRGFLDMDIVLDNALIDMYAKCGYLAEAQLVLQEITQRDIVSWSSLITGYAQQGQGHEALNCFQYIKKEGLSPNAITYISLLKACSSIGAIDKGKQIHFEIISKGLLDKDVVLGTAVVDMYAKCGALAKAQEVLLELPHRNTFSWSAVITGFARQGQGHEALNCFHEMQNDGISPDDVTLLCVLSACCHSGLLHEAKTLFEDMCKKYNVTPNLEHYICMVTAFGCAGHFDEAVSMIDTMPSSDFPDIWLALLTACRKWEYVELGKTAFDQIIQLHNSCAAAYALMSAIFSVAGMKADARKCDDMIPKCCGKMKQEMRAWDINVCQ